MLKSHKECIDIYGSDLEIGKKVANGQLFRVDRGMYSDRAYVPFVEIAGKRYPDSVVAMDSAFYYQGLTDVIPEVLHLATRRDAAKIQDHRIYQHYVPNEILHIGEVRVVHNSTSVRTYDLERLCIDVVRMRTKMPFDFYKEVVNSLRSRVHEMYPAKIDDYLCHFPYRDHILDILRKEVF